MGHMENIVRTDTHKGSYRKRQGRKKPEDKVRMYEGWGSNPQSVTKFGL